MNDNTPVQDSVEAFVAKLDAFAGEFARTAATPEQVKLAGQFRVFVDKVEPAALGKSAMPAVLRDYREFILRGPEMDLDP